MTSRCSFRVGTSDRPGQPGDAFFNAGEKHKLLLSLETINTNDYGERYHVGGEYILLDFLALRGGYRFNYEEGNLSLGIGLHETFRSECEAGLFICELQYLESPHRISLTIAY